MAETKVVNLEVKDNSEEANKNFQKLADSIDKLNETINETNKESKKAADSVEEVGKSGAAAEGGLKKVGKGFKAIGTAFKAMGIGLIVSAFFALKEVFTQNQKVADGLSTVFETISIVLNEVTNVVMEVYNSVSEATGGFDALGKVLGGITKLFIAPFKATFFGIKLAVEEVQLAWEKSPFGGGDLTTINELQDQIKQTKEDLKDVGKEVVQAGSDIATNLVEAAGEVGSFVTETVKGVKEISISAAKEQAKLNVEIRNQAEIAAAQQSLLIEKYDQQAEKLRQVRDEERNSIDERIEANNKLNDVLDKQQEALLKQADLQVRAAQNEVNKSDNLENQIALIEAVANREGVLAQIEGLRSEQLANDLALSKEKLELNQALIESQSALSFEEKKFNAERIEDDNLRIERLKEILEEEKQVELERLQNKIDSYKEGTQARLDAQIEYNTLSQELRLELISLEDEQRDLSLAKDLEANKKRAENEKQLQEAKFNAVSNTLSSISNIAELFAGKSKKQQERAFKVQKAANIASATMETYKGATAAFNSLASIPVVGPVLGGVAAAAAISAGLVNVKNIASQKFDGGGTPSDEGSRPNIPNLSTPQSVQPSFNIVGDSGVNELEALKSQPSKAYVVSGEVTTQQALDRNRQRNATL